MLIIHSDANTSTLLFKVVVFSYYSVGFDVVIAAAAFALYLRSSFILKLRADVLMFYQDSVMTINCLISSLG